MGIYRVWGSTDLGWLKGSDVRIQGSHECLQGLQKGLGFRVLGCSVQPGA